MRGNYIAVFIHAIWTTKYRLPVLPKSIRYPMFDHIRESVKEKEIDLRIVNGVEDHVHCLFRLMSTQTYAKVVKDLKGESSRWLNVAFVDQPDWKGYLEKTASKKAEWGGTATPVLMPEISRFSWQDGYGAISVSPQNVPKTTRYILNQEQHHAKKSLDDELRLFQYYSDLEENGGGD